MTAGPLPKPGAEIDIDADLVRRLLAEQHPDLADLGLELVAAGWDNELYRLGTEFVVRLPRRSAAASLVEGEQRWLPEVTRRVPLAIPAPVRVGRPTDEYPWRWSVCPWLPGRSMLEELPSSSAQTAGRLADFVAALHVDAPPELPHNPVRGVPLASRSARMHEHARRLVGLVDVDAVLRLWEALAAVPPWAGEPQWLHGDLHRGNVLIDRGRLSAVIDFGDMCGGDPATDLSAAWIVIDADARHGFRAALDRDDDTWQRARGWALALGVAYAASGADAPAHLRMGLETIAAALTDPLA